MSKTKAQLAVVKPWGLKDVEMWIEACEDLLYGYKEGLPTTHHKCPLCHVKDRMPGPGFKSCPSSCVWFYFTGRGCSSYAQKLSGKDDVPHYLDGDVFLRWKRRRLAQLPQWIAQLKRFKVEKEKDVV